MNILRYWKALLLCLLLTACQSLSAGPVAPNGMPLVTAVANPTPSPTPYQPSALSPGFLGIPTPASLPTLVPTSIQPSPTSPPPFNPTLPPAPTPDLSSLLPDQNTGPANTLGDNETINILLLGSDLRIGYSYRTDTIIIAVIRPKTAEVTLISVPRDLWVNIPTIGMQRVNTAYQFGETTGYPGGGPGLLKDTLTYNLGIRLDHHAMVDFDGFRRIVDTLGGLDLPISCPYTDWRLYDPSYDPENENNWYLHTAGPGLVHMDGDLALWYARSRSKSSDFDRGRRQQEVLRAIYQRALTADALSQVPQLYNDLNSAISTDLGLDAMLRLAPLGLQMSNASIRSFYINKELVTPWMTPGGAAVLLPNPEAISAMLQVALAPSTHVPQVESLLIEVQNGSIYEGWDALAAERLNYAGYQTQLAPADARTHLSSLLYDLTPDQNPTRAASLLAILGLPPQALVSVPAQNSPASYVFIVGADYQTCFNPSDFSR